METLRREPCKETLGATTPHVAAVKLGEKVVALELDPSHENSAGRSGLWIFGGDLFLRVVGVPRGARVTDSNKQQQTTLV